MGLIDKDKFEIKPGIGATTSNMSEYLSKLQLTDEQQQAFKAKLDSGEFDKIKDDLNSHKLVINADGEVSKGQDVSSANDSHESTAKTDTNVKTEDGAPKVNGDDAKVDDGVVI